MVYKGIIHRYKDLLDIPQNIKAISLAEGNTPLIPVPAVAKALGASFALFIKFEGLNPTGSFKDRGMTTAVSEAAHRGAKAVICASTGNTAASAAAYAARAGMRAVVIIPAGKVAAGKLAGAIAYGADVIQIDGSFDDALTLVVKLSEKHPIALVNSLNPFRLQGQKTAAFEICDALGKAPDWLALPVGNAGNITAYWMGFTQYNTLNNTRLPHVLGEEALSVAQASNGMIVSATDEEILAAQNLLAASGIWVEPASAAGIAGLKNKINDGTIELEGKQVVAVCTGHGLKDPDIIAAKFKQPKILPPNLTTLEEHFLPH